MNAQGRGGDNINSSNCDNCCNHHDYNNDGRDKNWSLWYIILEICISILWETGEEKWCSHTNCMFYCMNILSGDLRTQYPKWDKMKILVSLRKLIRLSASQSSPNTLQCILGNSTYVFGLRLLHILPLQKWKMWRNWVPGKVKVGI